MEKKEEKTKHAKVLVILLAALLAANVILAGLLVQSISERKHLEAQFENTTEVFKPSAEKIDMMLPETIYAATGITMEIYNAQVTSLGSDIVKYNVLWNCEIGENLERKFSVTAEEANLGDYELVLEIYDHQLQLVTEKTCILKIVEEDTAKIEATKAVTQLSEVGAECIDQVKICVDTMYNGSLEALKPEGIAQMQDVVYSVLSGI